MIFFYSCALCCCYLGKARSPRLWLTPLDGGAFLLDQSGLGGLFSKRTRRAPACVGPAWRGRGRPNPLALARQPVCSPPTGAPHSEAQKKGPQSATAATALIHRRWRRRSRRNTATTGVAATTKFFLRHQGCCCEGFLVLGRAPFHGGSHCGDPGYALLRVWCRVPVQPARAASRPRFCRHRARGRCCSHCVRVAPELAAKY